MGKTWVSPYNDSQVIAGQGTVGLELEEQVELGPGTTVVIPVGGGGLLAGVATALRSQNPLKRLRIVGVQPEASAFMRRVVSDGTSEGVADLPTLADGLAGGVEAGPDVRGQRARADEIVLVSEEEIAGAVAHAWLAHGEVIEGSGAVTLAAALAGKVRGQAILVVSGGNIDADRRSAHRPGP